MPFGTWSAQYITSWALHGEAGAMPIIPNTLIGLWIGDPGPDKFDGREVTGNGYTRVPMGIADWQLVGTGGYNAIEITFPEAIGGPWSTEVEPVTHVIVMTNIGFSLFYGSLITPKEIPEGSIPRFAISDLGITLI